MMGANVDVTIDRATLIGVKEAQQQRLLDSADVGFAISQERVPVDRGTLQQTALEPQIYNGDIVWGYTRPYADDVEFGTEPYRPPLADLEAWGKRVAGSEEFGRKVWSKIAQEGQSEQPYVRPGITRQKEWLKRHGIDEYLNNE